jgi:hypothetical protein
VIAGRIVDALAVLVAATFGALMLYYVVGLLLVIVSAL